LRTIWVLVETWGAAMSEQRDDFFGEIFQRYFMPAIGADPQSDGRRLRRILAEHLALRVDLPA
jgi:hypothetical protein